MADKGKDTEETISSPAVPQTKREIRKHTWMEWWQAAKNQAAMPVLQYLSKGANTSYKRPIDREVPQKNISKG
ncbi:hypothetical protein FRC19_009545 [Serendipita sp. 401]|nr:hypothetical protein FRC19_009545 [Serendipita sp. 401]